MDWMISERDLKSEKWFQAAGLLIRRLAEVGGLLMAPAFDRERDFLI